MSSSSFVTTSSLLFDVNATTATGEQDNATTAAKQLASPSYESAKQIIVGIEFFLALFGNIFVLAHLWKHHRNNPKRMHLLMMHVAIADLVVALGHVLPEWIKYLEPNFRGGNALCKFYKSMGPISLVASILIILIMAFDRFEAVNYPMRFRNRSKTQLHLCAAAAWVLAILFSLPQWFLFEKVGNKCTSPATESIWKAWQDVLTWYFIIVFVIPIVLLAYFYGKIAWTLKQNYQGDSVKCDFNISLNDPSQPLRSTDSGEGLRSTASKRMPQIQRKTIVMTLVIVMAYIICWLPYWIVQLVYIWKLLPNPVPCTTEIVIIVVDMLGPIATCVNPWIYLYFSVPRLPCLLRRNPANSASDNSSTLRTTLKVC